jgi:hypothetical protein
MHYLDTLGPLLSRLRNGHIEDAIPTAGPCSLFDFVWIVKDLITLADSSRLQELQRGGRSKWRD